ncbi:MAG TPA: hypothetical protein VEJ41_06920, partial [Candidatus Acidoferrales bacterium]|nr:hypothetical protein [Candidatus Acidoferrales bacterium]
MFCAMALWAPWAPVSADPAPQPSASAAVWQTSIAGFTSLVDQSTNGPGTQPPEGPGFANGSPLSPMTPYDTFSSAPMTPGVAGIAQFGILESYTSSKIIASLHASVGGVEGSVTNAAYWTENLMPALNPHLGSQALPYAIRFPTSAGQDDAGVARAAIDGFAIGSASGAWQLRAGYFDLAQTERFVFVQPPLTNQSPETSLAPAESLGNGAPSLDAWPTPPPGLPLDGLDANAHQGSWSAEISDAALPALPGTAARIENASLFWDRGSSHVSGQCIHLSTGGAATATTALFGAGAALDPSPQGLLPTSTLGGQRSTIVGVHAAFAVVRTLGAAVDFGRAWYDASDVFEPGTSKPGDYLHAGLTQPLGSASASLDLYRFEPRYATAILPYGAPENVWSVAWSWPGIWLKSTYQLADNTAVGANRQGYRLHFTQDGRTLDLHAAFAEFHQIDPSGVDLANQTGFVEGFFLPEQPEFETFGLQKQAATWLAWHPNSWTATFDFVDDAMHRDAAPSQPQDGVSYEAPQTVLTVSKSLSRKLLAAAGFARYSMLGSWAHGASTNVDYQQNVAFAGG